MNEHERISALMDGELTPAERDALLTRMTQESDLATTWRRYQLAHAALQHEAPFATDLSSRVMAALDAEPVVLVPRSLRQRMLPVRPWLRNAVGVALAASLSFGLLSVWQSGSAPSSAQMELTSLYRDASHPQVLVAPEATGAGNEADTSSSQVALNDNDRENAYMLAHAEYSERGLDDGIMPFARVAGQSEDQ